MINATHDKQRLRFTRPEMVADATVVPSRPTRQNQPPDSRPGGSPPTSESQSASSVPVTPNGGGGQGPAGAGAGAQANAQAPPATAASGPGSVPVRFYALHRDYLVPQSSLFRTILTGGFKDGSAEVKGCKLLPYTSLHGPRPVFVPLPDPESFDALVHWMYFGDIAKLESQLSSGEVKWRGLIRNIQYLGCDERTRAVVAKWWQRWAAADNRRAQSARGAAKDKADSDDEGESGGVAVPGRRGGGGTGHRREDDDDDDERESSYDNTDDKLSSPWRSTENLSYSVDADEMTRRLGGL